MQTVIQPTELQHNSKELLTELFKVFSELNFPCPNEWQWTFASTVFARLMGHIERGENNFIDKYAMCGAYGTGKTTIVIYTLLWLMIWADMTYPKKKVKGVVISGSEDQLYAVVWEDIKNLINNSPAKKLFVINNDRLYLKNKPNIWIEPRVANPNNLHSLAGIHADIVIVLLEEAPVIPNEVLPIIFKFYAHTTQSCMGFLFMTGNPINKGSFFYDIMENEGRTEWDKFRIGRADTVLDGDLSKDLFTQQIKEMYGEDSDEYRQSVLGEHALNDTSAFIPEYSIQAALNRNYLTPAEPYVLSIDVAGGEENSDYSAMILRGQNVVLDAFYRKIPPDELLEEAMSWIECRNVSVVILDEVAIGKDMSTRLHKHYYNRKDIQIIGFKGNMKPYDPWRFPDQNTEVTWKAKEWLELFGHLPKHLPYLDILLGQLRAFRSIVNNRGFYTLESKSKMTRSPDLADAFRYSFAGGRMATTTRVLPLVNWNQCRKQIKRLM